MIAAKYRLFSAEPKLVSSRDARTEEAAVLGISIWSPRDKSRMFECISRWRSAWCRNTELSDHVESETTKEAPPWKICTTSA